MNFEYYRLPNKTVKYVVSILVLLFFINILIRHLESKNEEISVIKTATKQKFYKQIIAKIDITQGVYTLVFNKNDKLEFIPLIWNRDGLLRDFIKVGDTISKEENSNKVLVNGDAYSFHFYFKADTTNIKWQMKNLPNYHFAE